MSEMTREQRDKAIAIAKDVIEQIKLKEHGYRMMAGIYLEGKIDSEIPSEGDLKDYVNVIQENCSVCQLGALMLSKARLYDAVPMESLSIHDTDINDRGRFSIVECLDDIFSREQINLMECAFEREQYLGNDASNEKRYEAEQFAVDVNGPKRRAIMIMRNLIEHDGEFIP